MKPLGKILGKTLPAMEGIDAAAFLEDFAVSEDSDNRQNNQEN
jgi:hypothetical protein